MTAVLQGVPQFAVVHQCANGKDLLDALSKVETDLVVTDFSMTREDRSVDGFGLLAELRRRHPDVKIVLLTALVNAGIFTRALSVGVGALVSKTDSISELARACARVKISRSPYLSPAVQSIIHGASMDHPNTSKARLTPKELEVVRLLVAGRSLAQIASQLGRSPSTISTQKYNASRKIGATSYTQLIRYAYENGLT